MKHDRLEPLIEETLNVKARFFRDYSDMEMLQWMLIRRKIDILMHLLIIMNMMDMEMLQKKLTRQKITTEVMMDMRDASGDAEYYDDDYKK